MKTFTVTIRDINNNRSRSTVIPGRINTFTGAIRKVNKFKGFYYRCDFEITCNYSSELLVSHWQDNHKYTSWKYYN